VEVELNEFASKSSLYVAQHGIELRSAISTLEEIVRSLTQRQDFYAARLTAIRGADGIHDVSNRARASAGNGGLQVAGLLSCVESMSHETQSLVMRMRNELGAVEQRLRESEVTDPLTGLMNRERWNGRSHRGKVRARRWCCSTFNSRARERGR